MNKLIYFRIPVEIYSHNVDVFICGTDKEKERVMKRLGYHHVFAYDTLIYMADSYACVVRPHDKQANYVPIYFSFPVSMKRPLDISVVSHELLHATAQVMRSRGVEFHQSSEEAYAYLLDYLTKQFWVKLNAKKGTK